MSVSSVVLKDMEIGGPNHLRSGDGTNRPIPVRNDAPLPKLWLVPKVTPSTCTRVPSGMVNFGCVELVLRERMNSQPIARPIATKITSTTVRQRTALY